MKPGTKIMGEDLGLCPCGKKIWADYQHCAVIHELPPCQPYLALDPIEFMRYVQTSRGISDS